MNSQPAGDRSGRLDGLIARARAMGQARKPRLAVVADWMTTVDHKKIAILYFLSGMTFLLIAGMEGQLIRVQLAQSELRILDPNLYNQLFTMHGTTMVFFAGMPLIIAYFNFVVPLQIGARDVAFPRLNMFSWWLAVFGGLFLYASVPLGSMPDGGWFAYTPLTNREYSPGRGMDFYVLALLLAGVGTIAGGVNFVVTILNLRAPGMTFMRLPLFTWMALVVSILILLAFPPFTVGLLFLLFDRNFGTHFFDAAAGADPLLWQHLFWVFGHPEVYILVLPAFGIASEVIPTFSRKGLFGYPVVVFSGVLIAFLGFGVWAHHMFAVGMGPLANSVFAGATMLIAVPTGIKIFNWIATMWGGKLRFTTPMLWAIGLVSMFIIGGLSGVMHASPPTDLQQTDTYFIVAHFHYVLIGGLVFGLFAGLYFWFPKATGKMLSDKLGKWHFWLTLAAFNITFFPMHFSGLLGMPRRTFTYPSELGLDGFNLVSTIGAGLFTVAFVPLIVNLWKTLRNGEPAGANPWGAPTLEWSTGSPPPHYNFAVVPRVQRRDPLWHPWIRPEEEEAGDHEDAGPGGVEPRLQPEVAPEPVVMPSNSWWPMVMSIGMLIATVGGLGSLETTLVGAAITLVGLFGWAFEPAFRDGAGHL